MIREATNNDVAKIVDLLERFHADAEQPQRFIEKDTTVFMAGMIESPDAIVLISEDGLICGLIGSSPINSSWKIAFELFWYATDGQGSALLDEYMKKTDELGVDEVRLSHRAVTPKVGNHFNRMGLAHDETVYSRLNTCVLVQ